MLSTMAGALGQLLPWLLSILVKSSVLLLFTLAVTQLMRQRSASLRHFLHSVAIVSALLLPIAASMLPELRLSVLPRPTEPGFIPVAEPVAALSSHESQSTADIAPELGQPAANLDSSRTSAPALH